MTRTLLASVSWSILCIAVTAYAQGPKVEVPPVRSILIYAKQSGSNILDKKTHDLFLRDLAVTFGMVEDLETAREIIGALPDKRDQNWVLLRIIQSQAEAGNVHGALNTTTTFQEQSLRDDALRRIALAQAQTADVNASLRTTRGIFSQSAREQTLVEIMKMLAGSGDIQNARKTASLIQGGNSRDLAVIEIARDQARKRDIPGALQTADLFPSGRSRDNVLMNIALVQAYADTQGARNTASIITTDSMKQMALRNIELAEGKEERGEDEKKLFQWLTLVPFQSIPNRDFHLKDPPRECRPSET